MGIDNNNFEYYHSFNLITKGIKMSEGIRTAIQICGSQALVAKACGVSQPTVFKWLSGGKMDVKHIPEIIKATEGKVRAEDLRPDVDWAVIRNS